MPDSLSAFVNAYPLKKLGRGSFLLRRGVPLDAVLWLEQGMVVLGVAAEKLPAKLPEEVQTSTEGLMEHQLGLARGPVWLQAYAAVLDVTPAMDAMAQTDVSVRNVPLAEFQACVAANQAAASELLRGIAQAHAQQTALAVSRLAKDAQARFAQWLLRQAEFSEKAGARVQLQQRKRAIAAQLGIAPETLSRVLRHLREDQLISGSGSMVRLVNPGGLRELAGA